LNGDSPSADFCLATDKIMPENPYIHPMWKGSYFSCLRVGADIIHPIWFYRFDKRMVSALAAY
jgi:hypothetical protein